MERDSIDQADSGTVRCMQVAEVLTRMGGTADVAQLRGRVSRKRLRTALTTGEIVRVRRGRYALPTATDAVTAAARLSGVASHHSAAAAHGWGLARQPERPCVIVPRNRKVDPRKRKGVDLRYRDLESHEVDGMLTSPHRTVIDCARDLPFTEALAIADSALRECAVDHEELVRRAAALPTTGRTHAMRVVEHATGLAANAFESTLRGITLSVPGLQVESQVTISVGNFRARPDLVDRRLRIVLEADSYEFHGGRKEFAKDCHRYNSLVALGWVVLRFSYEDVMYDPERVRGLLVSVVERVEAAAARTA